MEENYINLLTKCTKKAKNLPGTIFFVNVLFIITVAIIVPNKLFAQTKNSLIYNKVNLYKTGTAITPLVPVSTLKPKTGLSIAPISMGSGFNNPLGVAADAAGNVYVTDNSNSLLKRIPANGGTPVIVGSGFKFPAGVALDAAGNIYVADYGNDAVKKIPVTGGSPVTIGSGFSGPTGVAVDTKGNVYVADRTNRAVKMIPVGGGVPVTIGTDFNYPAGVTVDTAGNVYVADYCNNDVKKIIVNGGGTVTLGSGFNHPNGVAVDATGNVYVSDEGNNAIKEIIAGSGKTVSLGSGFKNPFGVYVDAGGNIYTGDAGNNAVKKLGLLQGYVIKPALSGGLVLNAQTGIISGTPTAACPKTTYTITNFNKNASVSATVSIQVDALQSAPVVKYNTTANIYTTGIAVTPLEPESTSGITGYTISPSLPFGLTFDGSKGIISGTPKEASDQTTYTIKANATQGTAVATITITVLQGATNVLQAKEPQPVVKYNTTANIYTTGISVTPLEPESSAGITGYTISPSLPLGLTFDGSKGIISGIPKEASDQTTYTIKANATQGTAVATITITVLQGATNVVQTKEPQPVVKYNTTANIYTTGISVTPLEPESSAGITGYTISPSLPLGLTFDESKGIISGTPKEASDQTTYTIKANATQGTAVATITITVLQGATNVVQAKEPQPVVKYNTTANIYTTGISVTPLEPESSAGITGYTISPSLPLGLTFDESKGIISGTPKEASDQTTYTIKANATQGTAVATITITVYQGAMEPVEASELQPIVIQAVSPNGDGINDVLTIENIENYPNNKLVLINRSGTEVYEASGYDNVTKVFNGHSNLNNAMQRPGTYFYMLEYTANGKLKRKTGYFILKY